MTAFILKQISHFPALLGKETLKCNTQQQFISYASSQLHFPRLCALVPPRLMLTLGLLCYGVAQGSLLWPRDAIIRLVFMTAAEMGSQARLNL